MIRVALRGLAARPLRTALTALAIVLGVAMVSGAFTLTDTMRGAADSLSDAAYDGTDAVVDAPRPLQGRRDRLDGQAADGRRDRCSTQVRASARASRSPPATSPTRPRSSARDGKPVGDGPYFGVGYRRADAGRRALTPFRLDVRPLGHRPGRGRHRRRHRREAALRASARPCAIADRAARRASFRSSASRVRRPSSRSAPRRSPCSTCRPRRRCSATADATTRSSSPARDGVAARRAARGPSRRRRRRPQVQTAAAQDRFTLDGPEAVHLDHQDRAARVRLRRDLRRRVHDLQHAVDHRRPARA